MRPIRKLLRRLSARPDQPPAPPPPPQKPEGDAETWRPGDLAECIHDGPWFLGGCVPNYNGPQKGDRRVVAGVRIVKFYGRNLPILRFARYPGEWYAATCFRKITPKADEAITHDRHFLDRWLPAREPV